MIHNFLKMGNPLHEDIGAVFFNIQTSKNQTDRNRHQDDGW